jgi:hypothetical protein
MAQLPTRIFVWEVFWSNYHKPRPEGYPEVMLRVEQPVAPKAGAGPCPVEIDECWQELCDYGYGIRVYTPHVPVRALPIVSKQRIRRRNLWKRLLTRYPLFLSDFYAASVQARPDYYGEYTAGEFADVTFARGLMGSLKVVGR